MADIHYLPRGIKMEHRTTPERRVSLAQTLDTILKLQQSQAARIESLHDKVERLQPMHRAWEDATGAYRLTKSISKLIGIFAALGGGISVVWFFLTKGEWRP